VYRDSTLDKTNGEVDMIEMGKRYQTRDGRAVRILATDFKAGATCIIGAIAMADTNEIVGLWNARGEEFGGFDHLDDLIPVPTKHEGWCVLYGGLPYIFDTKDDAEHQKKVECSRSTKIVAHVTWED
jgi:hypothetical protein